MGFDQLGVCYHLMIRKLQPLYFTYRNDNVFNRIFESRKT